MGLKVIADDIEAYDDSWDDALAAALVIKDMEHTGDQLQG